ncbi:MAG: sulfatase-like hydrolase/transferase [Pseudoflavonifractor sp.]|nr:sulfatase-like hydrolase/transferase [Alloprevotella sp.]MCM1117618.1 sulfatase-like hydrolase/transferase [Pseudoflavonifractor sp.]
MKNTSALASALALAGAFSLAARAQQTDPQRPNVIVILADDLGYGDMEPYGATLAHTPNVNRLAEEGTKFTNVHAVASTSTPSRYSLLTGQYAWRRPDTGVAAGNAGMIIRPEQYTMADMFRNSGYSTAAFGKWHLGLGDKTGEQDWNAPLPASPADIGFDHHYIMAATADRVPCVFIEDGMVANYDPSAPIEVSYKANFPGEPTGRNNPELLTNLRHSHGHDMSIVNGIGRIGYMKGGGKALWKDENIADSITLHAVDWIRAQAASDKPFFAYICTNDVHVPRFPHDRFRGKNPMGLRGDAIEQFDWTVGQILDAIDEAGIADNTLVILTSDNGPVLDDGYADRAAELVGSHRPTGPFRGNKYSAFEGGTMVPAIVRWPGKVPSGKESDALMSHIDWMASLGNLIGARLPKGAAPDSRVFRDALLGLDPKGADWIVEQSDVLSLRTPQWKYIEASDYGPKITWGPDVETGYAPLPQLYDMTGRRDETENVALENPAVVFDLQNILRRVRSRR